MSSHGPGPVPGTAAGVAVQVMGPFSLAVDGAALVLGQRKARALVAVLALEGPRPRGELADLLWGELGEIGARTNLRKALHALRDTALGAYLDTSGGRVACRAAWVDLLEFEAWAAAGDYARALECGAGPLLEDLEFESESWNEWLEGRRASLAARRRQVTLGLATVREARGDVRGALALVTRVLDDDPYDEPAVQEAMRLQLNLGERESAATLYERFRRLTAPLGVEPEAATQALAARARSAPDDTAAREAGRVRTATLRAPLVGREAAWLQLSRSATRLCALVGEPGVGKTRLATEFAGAHGAVLVMQGREETRHTPFYPVAQLIRDALTTRRWSPDRLSEVWRLEVARLVPDCVPGQVPPTVADAGRARFLEGLSRAVTGVLAGQLLVLDDLHWFDEDTLELVAHLLRTTGDARCLATARASELQEAPTVRRTLDSLRREGLAEVLELEPLRETEVLALVQGLSGAGGGLLFARRLHRASSGNPLYLLELLRGLLETGVLVALPGGGWETPFDDFTLDYAELPIPPSLRDTVLERVARLGPAAHRLLEGAALAGDHFESAWLAGVEPSEFARLDALEAACRAEVLESIPSGFRFRHELLRRALDESLGQERRRALHRALATQLQAARGAPERVAYHLDGAGTPEAAVPYLERAAEAAAQVYAFRQALSYTERMLEHERGDARRWLLERRRMWFLSLTSDAATYEGELLRIEQLAQQSGDPNRRAEVYFMRGLFHLFRGQPAEIAAQAQAMLALPGLSDESRVNALYVDGHAQSSLGHAARAIERFSQALELRRTGRNTEASISPENIENGLTRAYLSCGAFEQAAVHNARVLERLEATHALALVYALNWRGHLATLRGEFGRARDAFGEAASRAAQRNDPGALTWVLRHRTALFVELGDAQAALGDIGEVLERAPGQYLRLEAILGGLRAEALRLQGALGEAFGAVRAALAALERTGLSDADPALAELRGTFGRLLIDCGDLPAAQAEIGAARAQDQASDGLSLRLSRAARETAAARIELIRGQHARALQRLQATPSLEHAPYSDRVAHATELAHAMTLTGDPGSALRHLAPLQPTPPLRPRLLQAQLAAQLALGRAPEDLLAQASAALIPAGAAPGERLELMVTLSRGLGQANRDASAVQALARTTLAALAASLDGAPHWRSGLLRRFPTVAPG